MKRESPTFSAGSVKFAEIEPPRPAAAADQR
jgi:hypothetical protein